MSGALLRCLLGYVLKFLIDVHILKPSTFKKADDKDGVIVSLTSYGRRVEKCVVYYTLVSLMRQSVMPNKIILWLSKDEWNMNTIPRKIYDLTKNGLEIRFCDDLRSYKKLIPSLLEFPESTIITFDDDCIYPRYTLENMLEEQKDYPKDIICYYASQPVIINGIPQNYKSWKTLEATTSGVTLFPIGAAGILYPPHSLHEDVCKVSLFQQLCPSADDVWFWFCGIRNGTNKRLIEKRGVDVSFDGIYQFFHKESSLTNLNKGKGKNDIQLNNLFKYYNVAINNKGELYNL